MNKETAIRCDNCGSVKDVDFSAKLSPQYSSVLLKFCKICREGAQKMQNRIDLAVILGENNTQQQ